jgi:hypothetical protein
MQFDQLKRRRAHMAYDHGGIEALKPKPNGGRIHQKMTLAEERRRSCALLEQPAPARC